MRRISDKKKSLQQDLLSQQSLLKSLGKLGAMGMFGKFFGNLDWDVSSFGGIGHKRDYYGNIGNMVNLAQMGMGLMNAFTGNKKQNRNGGLMGNMMGNMMGRQDHGRMGDLGNLRGLAGLAGLGNLGKARRKDNRMVVNPKKNCSIF